MPWPLLSAAEVISAILPDSIAVRTCVCNSIFSSLTPTLIGHDSSSSSSISWASFFYPFLMFISRREEEKEWEQGGGATTSSLHLYGLIGSLLHHIYAYVVSACIPSSYVCTRMWIMTRCSICFVNLAPKSNSDDRPTDRSSCESYTRFFFNFLTHRAFEAGVAAAAYVVWM